MDIYVVINATDKGHAARCSRCGWQSKSFPIPDTAFTAALKHDCVPPDRRTFA